VSTTLNGAHLRLFWREKKSLRTTEPFLRPTVHLAGPFFYNRTDRVFFQSLREKNKKQKFFTRNPGDTMGVSGFGSFFCLWAVRARSNRWRALIGS
jgi:hypothetical protein